jgi:hypothetical protein
MVLDENHLIGMAWLDASRERLMNRVHQALKRDAWVDLERVEVSRKGFGIDSDGVHGGWSLFSLVL